MRVKSLMYLRPFKVKLDIGRMNAHVCLCINETVISKLKFCTHHQRYNSLSITNIYISGFITILSTYQQQNTYYMKYDF